MISRIILADHQAIFRTGMARVLSLEPGFAIAAQCTNAAQLQQALAITARPLVVFTTGLDAPLHTILDWIEAANGRSVVVTEHGSDIAPEQLYRIEGVVQRSVPASQLVECIQRVAAGERSVQRLSLRSQPATDRVGSNVLDRLTPRELEIITLVTEGAKNKEIANELGTKEQVVKNYLRAIYDKTGVSDRLELALFTVHHRALAEATERVRKDRQ